LTAQLAARHLVGNEMVGLLAGFRSSKRRLLLLDYDGTLAPFAGRPEYAVPDQALLDLLEELGRDEHNEVVIVSGRERDSLGAWLGHLPITLVAEHGAWVKTKDSPEWMPTVQEEAGWKGQFRPLLQAFVDRIPGSLVEEKVLSLAWHYRNADIAIASLAAKELIDGLTNLAANTALGVLQGNRVVEIKNECITKGGYYQDQLAGGPWDFILALGDDWTDESLFRALPRTAYSIKVGFGPSAARYSLPSPAEVCALLKDLTVQATTLSN
jgi:trehalose 6-phosphate synthase/phosphatase